MLLRGSAYQIAGRNHVYQQEMHAGQDIVLIFRPQVEQLAEVVQRDGDGPRRVRRRAGSKRWKCHSRRPASF